MRAARVSVTTKATYVAGNESGEHGGPGLSLTIQNTDNSATAYLGGPEVTPATGYPVPPGGVESIILAPGEKVYAVSGKSPLSLATLWGSA